MPVRKVGPNSYQWGTSGKVYTGKDAKAKAERQGRAIYASGYKGAEDESDEEYWEPYLEALEDWYRLCYDTVNEAAESYAGMVQNIDLWLAVEEVSNERLSYILEKTWKYKYLATRLLWNQEVDAYKYLELMDNYLSSESASLLENFNPEGRDYEGEIVYTSWHTPYPELKVVREVFQPSWLPSEDWQGKWSEPYAFELFDAESYKPPASAIANAKRGLKLRKEWGRGGLSPSEAKSQGIDSGVTRARKIASGKVSRHDVRRMSAFNRHRKNYRPEKKMSDGGPTAGTIAWLLWGGTSGVNWAKKKSAAMNAESPHFYGNCAKCKQPMMLGIVDNIYGVQDHRPSAKICQECDHVLCGSCHPEAKVCPHCEVSFEAQRYQKQKQCAVCQDYEPYNEMMSCFVCGQNYCAACERFDTCAEYSSENWGGDADGPLAKALAKARESLKKPQKPLQITRLPDPNQKTLKDFEAESTHCEKCDHHPRHCECYCAWCKKDTPLFNVVRGEWVCKTCKKQHYEEPEYWMGADVIMGHRPYPNVYGRYGWHQTIKPFFFCWKCGDMDHHHSNCKSTQKYTDALSRKKDMLKAVNAAIKLYSNNPSDVNDLKELRRMIKNNHFGIARHYFNSLDTVVRDNIGYDTEISFEANWQDLPRNELGQWQRPVSEEVLQQLVDSDSMPTLSELLEMYGGDTPTNRWKLYKALMDIYISQDPTEDTIVDFSDNLEIETPEEYYQFILQEELDIPEDEDDTQSIEFWDRYSRYVASVYTSEEIEFMIAEAIESIDLFADQGDLKEITALNAALKLQPFMEKYQAE